MNWVSKAQEMFVLLSVCCTIITSSLGVSKFKLSTIIKVVN